MVLCSFKNSWGHSIRVGHNPISGFLLSRYCHDYAEMTSTQLLVYWLNLSKQSLRSSAFLAVEKAGAEGRCLFNSWEWRAPRVSTVFKTHLTIMRIPQIQQLSHTWLIILPYRSTMILVSRKVLMNNNSPFPAQNVVVRQRKIVVVCFILGQCIMLAGIPQSSTCWFNT